MSKLIEIIMCFIVALLMVTTLILSTIGATIVAEVGMKNVIEKKYQLKAVSE